MYVEMLEGRYAGQMRDIENGTALDLIKLGRAKRAFGEPTHAAPQTAGGFRDTTNAPKFPAIPGMEGIHEASELELTPATPEQMEVGARVIAAEPNRKKKK